MPRVTAKGDQPSLFLRLPAAHVGGAGGLAADCPRNSRSGVPAASRGAKAAELYGEQPICPPQGDRSFDRSRTSAVQDLGLGTPAKRRVKRGVWRSLAICKARINRACDDADDHCRPFTSTPTHEIAAVRRAHQVLN